MDIKTLNILLEKLTNYRDAVDFDCRPASFLLALFRWVIVVRFITEVSCWLMMRSGFNWPHHSLAFLCCLGSPWLKARCRYDCSGCVIVSHGSGLWVNLLRGSLLDSSTFWTLAVMYCYDWKQILSHCTTGGEHFKRWGCLCDLLTIFFSSVDLCHCWRDVYGRGHHRLLHIYCFRGLEEDPDRKNVVRTAPLPSSDLIYKCYVASLFAKSNPCLNQLPFWRSHHRDQRSSFGTWSNYQAPKAVGSVTPGPLRVCLLQGDAWTLTFTCPLPPFPASAGARAVSGFNSFGYLKVIFLFYLIFSVKFMSISKNRC